MPLVVPYGVYKQKIHIFYEHLMFSFVRIFKLSIDEFNENINLL